MSPSKVSWDEEDFHRWRPLCHLMSTHGWLNDPCAPSYDTRSKTYYIGFQWNPKGWDWGNIAWGSATSKDLVNWEVSPIPSIAPSPGQDSGGVFTGCMSPVRLQDTETGSLSVFYTSAQQLPIHYTRDYSYGSEVIHAAISTDGGLTWLRHPANPVLCGPPEDLNVTGWRDPSVFSWESYDIAQGRPPGSGLYGIVAGGIKDKTPTVFLYTIDRNNLMNWTFLTTLFDLGLNFSVNTESIDLGINFEVANIMTLHDHLERDYEIVLIGVEGCNDESSSSTSTKHKTRAKRAGRSQQWLCGTFSYQQDVIALSPPKLTYDFGGSLDWGMFYAANSFHDPVSGSQVVHGWVLEEDLDPVLREQQGWSGLISFARILKMKTYEDVVKAPNSLPGFKKRYSQDGKLNLTTLCCVPDPRLRLLRDQCFIDLPTQKLMSRHATDSKITLSGLASFELKISFELDKDSKEAGLTIFHSLDMQSQTSLVYKAEQSEVVIERHKSSGRKQGISTMPEIAPHTLLHVRDSSSGIIERETLDIRIFYDVSVFEVFVNDRVAITTRVYPESGKCFGILPWTGDGEGAQLLQCQLWELRPGRPADDSSNQVEK